MAEKRGGRRGEAKPRIPGEKRAPEPAGSRTQSWGRRAERRRGSESHPLAAAPWLSFRPSPWMPTRLRSGTASRGTRSSRGSRKPFIISHLHLDATRCETAFPVSRETGPHVGLTSGRSDVKAYAAHQRGSGALLPRPFT